MKTLVHSKLLCILLMVSMFALGIYCEDVHTNSFFHMPAEKQALPRCVLYAVSPIQTATVKKFARRN